MAEVLLIRRRRGNPVLRANLDDKTRLFLGITGGVCRCCTFHITLYYHEQQDTRYLTIKVNHLASRLRLDKLLAISIMITASAWPVTTGCDGRLSDEGFRRLNKSMQLSRA